MFSCITSGITTERLEQNLKQLFCPTHRLKDTYTSSAVRTHSNVILFPFPPSLIGNNRMAPSAAGAANNPYLQQMYAAAAAAAAASSPYAAALQPAAAATANGLYPLTAAAAQSPLVSATQSGQLAPAPATAAATGNPLLDAYANQVPHLTVLYEPQSKVISFNLLYVIFSMPLWPQPATTWRPFSRPRWPRRSSSTWRPPPPAATPPRP